MLAFPAAAALVSTVFAIQLLTQYAHRKRLPQLAWGIAMMMYAIASLAVTAGVSGGWDPTLFRIYWLFGALLNVPYLALGSIALLGRRVVTAAALLAVLAGTVWGAAKVFTGSVNAAINGGTAIPKGSLAWMFDPSVRTLARAYSYPAFGVVVLIAVVSSRSRRLPVERVRGNWLIALGVTIVAIGSIALAGTGRGAGFSIALAFGVVVMFLGFRLASRPARAASPSLILYTSENCGLCEHAKDALAALGVEYAEILVPDDHEYRLRTPVLEADGRIVAEGQIDEPALRRALRPRR